MSNFPPPTHSRIVLLHALEVLKTHFNHLAKCTGPADRGHTRVHYVLLIVELYYTLISRVYNVLLLISTVCLQSVRPAQRYSIAE